MVQSRVEQFQEVFKKLMGVIVLMSLFAIAELAPETNAEELNPMIGKWSGQSSTSNIQHTLRLEGDHSFTWDSNGKLIMSGTWIEEQGTLELKFGNEDGDSLTYQVRSLPEQLQLRSDEAEYNFNRMNAE